MPYREEMDYYQKSLPQTEQQMAYVKVTDKFGISWEVVPVEFNKKIRDPDPVTGLCSK